MSWKIPYFGGLARTDFKDSKITSTGASTTPFSDYLLYGTYNRIPWLEDARTTGDSEIMFTSSTRKIKMTITNVEAGRYYTGRYELIYIRMDILDEADEVQWSGQYQYTHGCVYEGDNIETKQCVTAYFDDDNGYFIFGILSTVLNRYTGETIQTIYNAPAASQWQAAYIAMGGSIEEKTDDPYQPGGYVNKQGGNGDFDSHSDPIAIPSLPSISAASVGLLTLYNPNTAQVEQFSNYLWSTDFDLDQFKKLFADPMDAIISLSIQPITPDGSTQYAKIGLIATPVQMKKMNAQYYEIDCGELSITEFYGSALDYSPTTKFQIYLPYIGIQQISPDDITTKTLRVVYHIDALTGDCICYLKVGASVLYTYTGNVATQVPVSSTNASTIYLSSSMRQVSGILSVFDSPKVTGAGAQGAMGQGILDMMTTKPSVNRSGSISGATGLMGIQKPYLIKEIPRQNLAKDAFKTVGYPSNISGTLSEFKGYTVVDEIHLENINATRAELDEIDSLLRGGYINAT